MVWIGDDVCNVGGVDNGSDPFDYLVVGPISAEMRDWDKLKGAHVGVGLEPAFQEPRRLSRITNGASDLEAPLQKLKANMGCEETAGSGYEDPRPSGDGGC